MALADFKSAQDAHSEGIADALRELNAGCKTGHWIWYVFPQLKGLGFSPMSRAYALQDIHEAVAYLSDPLLQSRLAQVTQAVADRLAQGDRLEKLMGGRIDARKLVSSLTLFELAARKIPAGPGGQDASAFAALCARVLAAAKAQGIPRCQYTVDSIRQG